MATDSHTQPFFAGQFHHGIDEKNRITIPSRWRSGEPEEFILLPNAREEFLQVMSPEEFSRVITKAENDPSVPARDQRVFLRHLHARAQHGSADKQGRLVLPEELCKQLALKDDVTLVGGRGRFEVWNTAKWKQAHKEEKATYERVADAIGL